MKIFLQKENKHKSLHFNGKVQELLKKLNINPVTVIVLRNGEIVLDDESLGNDDQIKILSVVSGG